MFPNRGRARPKIGRTQRQVRRRRSRCHRVDRVFRLRGPNQRRKRGTSYNSERWAFELNAGWSNFWPAGGVRPPSSRSSGELPPDTHFLLEVGRGGRSKLRFETRMWCSAFGESWRRISLALVLHGSCIGSVLLLRGGWLEGSAKLNTMSNKSGAHPCGWPVWREVPPMGETRIEGLGVEGRQQVTCDHGRVSVCRTRRTTRSISFSMRCVAPASAPPPKTS